VRANSSQDPILKKPFTKKEAGGVAQGIAPEFKTHNSKKKKERKKKTKNKLGANGSYLATWETRVGGQFQLEI
jgi:hypothetical protein